MNRNESRIAPSPEAESDDFASPFDLRPAEERAYWRGVAYGLTRAGAPLPPDIAARAEPPPGADSARSGQALPWEGDPPDESGRQRHDAFTGARKQLFLKALVKTGCILDACGITGISSSTVYNHQAHDRDFARNCGLAVGMASTPIELTAYERAVVGQEEPVIRGGVVVGTRIRRSDYMLRVLLQGANPKKYGPRPGFTRKRLLKFERKRIEREVRARMAEHRPPLEKVTERIVQRVENIKRHRDRQRRTEGWTELSCGVWVPPGWVWAGEGDPNEAAAETMKKIGAVCNSSKSSTSESSEPPSPDADGDADIGEGPIEYKSLFPPSSRQRPGSMNTKVRSSHRWCSWIPDQVRDDDPPDIQTAPPRHPS